MTATIENLCYEYSDDVLFSKDVHFCGAPVLIIIYLRTRYLKELSLFLKNYGYRVAGRKNHGRHFTLMKFELINLSYYDQGLSEENRGWEQDP